MEALLFHNLEFANYVLVKFCNVKFYTIYIYIKLQNDKTPK